VEHPVRWGVNDTVPPVDPVVVLVIVVPEQGVALAGDGVDVEVGAVAVALLVGPDEDVPSLVELEVAVPRSAPAFR